MQSAFSAHLTSLSNTAFKPKVQSRSSINYSEHLVTWVQVQVVLVPALPGRCLPITYFLLQSTLIRCLHEKAFFRLAEDAFLYYNLKAKLPDQALSDQLKPAYIKLGDSWSVSIQVCNSLGSQRLYTYALGRNKESA
ncbi:hypothetical protein HRR81_002906 [Exophiala dermatitidis]|nr:hypothetical protein HRR73_005440 [Exophiala dermatitidis]KAJ4578758.1 hypothetical protein HRR81_002906 [Exophiala dermatitidis]KAJ4650516.1 hypothetical protein HRR89_000596 [Exophiala dermatitidis]